MKSLPALLKGSGILTHYTTYPEGSIERAKSIGIGLIGSSDSLGSTLAWWQSELDIVEREQPWKPLGLKSSADFIRAVTTPEILRAVTCLTDKMIDAVNDELSQLAADQANERAGLIL